MDSKNFLLEGKNKGDQGETFFDNNQSVDGLTNIVIGDELVAFKSARSSFSSSSTKNQI